jgi:hypothetical protein
MEYDRRVVPLFRHQGEGSGEVPVSAGSVALAPRPGTPWFPIDPESDTQPIPAIRLPAVPAVQPGAGPTPGTWSLLRAGLLVIAALAVAVALTLALAVAVSGHSATAGANGPASARAVQAGPAGPAARA